MKIGKISVFTVLLIAGAAVLSIVGVVLLAYIIRVLALQMCQ